MDKEKAKALSKTLACYKELQENNSVNLIEFHTADGQKHGIGNPEAIKLLLSVAVIELERQLRLQRASVDILYKRYVRSINFCRIFI